MAGVITYVPGKLQKLLFGLFKGYFVVELGRPGFAFSTTPDLECGLAQQKLLASYNFYNYYK